MQMTENDIAIFKKALKIVRITIHVCFKTEKKLWKLVREKLNF